MEPTEVVTHWFDAFNSRDLDRLQELSEPDLRFHPMLIADVGEEVIEGEDAPERIIVQADSGWRGMRIAYEETRRVGDRVLVLGRLQARGRSSGLDIDIPAGWVFELRGERVRELLAFPDPDSARAAAGET
ncbi:MAG: nuclear transport factor 2 family protein [Thermoleophilaceae bacterium]